MTLLLDTEAAPPTLYRVGNEPDPWEWPGWSYTGDGRRVVDAGIPGLRPASEANGLERFSVG